MKKSTIITASILVILISTATGFKGQLGQESLDENWPTSTDVVRVDPGLSNHLNGTPTEITYDMGSRFILTVTKENLLAAKTIYDIVPGDAKLEGVSYASVSIRIVEGESQTDVVEVGSDPVLTPAQQKLLRSLDYASNFMIRVEVVDKDGATGTTKWDYATPYVTVVPEKQAVNSSGKEAMIEHVKTGTANFANIVDAKTLKPGKIVYAVTKEGTVSNVRLSVSSGYPALDERVIELVRTLPGSWEPATNAAGEKVEQRFVFSFGTVGC